MTVSEGEGRPVDMAHESASVAAEAAELAEHIRDTNPQWTREEQMDLLVDLIDDAHEAALETHVGLDNE